MRSSRNRRTTTSTRGFTLIELVVAMVVTALMALAIFMTFTAQNQLYRRQYDIGRTQQNLRLAMEIITKDVAMIGHGAGVTGEFYGQLGNSGPAVGGQPTWLVTEDLWTVIPANNIVGDQRDGIYINYMDPDRDVWGFVDQSEAGGGVGSDYRCGTDALHFTPSTAAAALTYQDPADPRFSRIVCASHSANTGLGVSYIWTVTGFSGNVVNVAPNSGITDYDNYCVPGRGLPEELTCAPLVRVRYYIDRDGDSSGIGTDTLPYLMLSFDDVLDDGNDIPIAAGIEDLQIGYCNHFDSCSGSWLSGWQDTAWDFGNLSRVRVRIGARSERQDEFGLPATSPVMLDTTYDPGTTQDAYHRRVAHQIVTLRNARAANQVQNGY